MDQPIKRFWVGSPDGYGQPDDDQAEGALSPDDDGMVYPRTKRGAKKEAPRRAGSGKGKKRSRRKS